VNFGASHGLGHVLGGAIGMPHGITSCVMLPSVLRYNAVLPEQAARQRLISEAMGDAQRSAADLVQALIASLGLPTRLRDAGVTEDMLESMSQKAMQSHWVRTNPRRVDEPAQALEILRSAW
jgi:maleylacetate reductase